MLYARSATRWPARTLALASISVAAFLFAAGSASAAPVSVTGAGLTIADVSTTASTQSADLTASSVVGNISHVTATLTGFAHACSIDADVLLVGPGGRKSLLMSDAGDCADHVVGAGNQQPKRAV